MKYTLMLAALALATPAKAGGEMSAHVAYGTKSGKGGRAPLEEHYVLGGIAAQTNDGSGLTSTVIGGTHIAVGNWNDISIVGDNNNVDVDATNEGDVTNVTNKGKLKLKTTN